MIYSMENHIWTLYKITVSTIKLCVYKNICWWTISCSRVCMGGDYGNCDYGNAYLECLKDEKFLFQFGFYDYSTNYPSQTYSEKWRLDLPEDCRSIIVGQNCLNYEQWMFTSWYYTQLSYSLTCRATFSNNWVHSSKQMVDPQLSSLEVYSFVSI